MAATPAQVRPMPLVGLPRTLVEAGLMGEEDATTNWQIAASERKSFVHLVVEKKLADARAVAQTSAHEFGTPVADLEAIELDPEVTRAVPEDLVRKHQALPLYKRGPRLFLGIADPTNTNAIDEIRFAVGGQTEAVLVEADKLTVAIEKALTAAESSLNMGEDDDFAGLDDLEVDTELNNQDEVGGEIDDAPVVRFVNKLLVDCMRTGASDIHIEPYEKYCRVRFRIDGVLEEVAKPPLQLANKITARVKVMARLDLAERRVPQDGRIKLRLSKTQALDFRVSTCPTLFGEKTVMRILDSSMSIPLDKLGYEDFQLELFLENLYKPYGMFLVTGPTGSGKTVSLYSGINLINQIDVNISTAEDPVEINLAGVNQVQVDERTGMTFSKALKSFLRQDPDIILVGEIRDLETAGIAIKAAQTGHMVMSTLHTNDAPQTLTRVVDMGVKPYAIATSINIITAQRLGRRLHSCKVKEDVPKAALLEEGFTEADFENGSPVIYAANGCDECTGGYKGRVGIYQVMTISDEMRRLVMEGRNAIDLADQARKEGIPDIRQSAIRKVRDGMMDIKELNRVTLE